MNALKICGAMFLVLIGIIIATGLVTATFAQVTLWIFKAFHHPLSFANALKLGFTELIICTFTAIYRKR